MSLPSDILISKSTGNTTTTQLQKLIPQLWAPNIEINLRAKACMQESVVMDESLLAPGAGDTVYIPSLPDMGDASAQTENVDMVDIVLSNATSVPFIPTEYGISVGMTRKALDRIKYDGIAAVMDRMTYSMTKKIEHLIAGLYNATVPVVGGSLQGLYAQTSATGTIAASNVFDDDLLARGVAQLEINNCETFDDGFWRLYISPQQKKELFQDTNVRNDLRWGQPSRIFKNELGVLHNCRIIVTNFVAQGAEGSGGAVTTYKSLLLSPRWAACAWKRRPELVLDPTVYDYGRRRRMGITADLDIELLHSERAIVLTSA